MTFDDEAIKAFWYKAVASLQQEHNQCPVILDEYREENARLRKDLEICADLSRICKECNKCKIAKQQKRF